MSVGTTIFEPEAALWAWNGLWTKESITHCSFDILDVLFIENKEVCGWLFTALDNSIKNKSKNKWKLTDFSQKCYKANTDPPSGYCAHVRTDMEWRVVSRPPRSLSEISESCKFVIACNSKSSNNGSNLIEQIIEISLNEVKPVKVVTYRLISKSPVIVRNAKPSNNIENYEDFPQLELNRVLSKDKRSNETVRQSSVKLIKLLEHRKMVRISSIRIIYAYEPSTDSSVDGSTNVWLHHVAEVTYHSAVASLPGNDSFFLDKDGATSSMMASKFSLCGSNASSVIDRKSQLTSLVTSDKSNRGQIKHIKCMGDFCSYMENEELRYMQQDIDFDLQKETRKAKQRHRQLTDAELYDRKQNESALSPVQTMKVEQYMNDEGDVMEAMDMGNNDIDVLLQSNEDAGEFNKMENNDGFNLISKVTSSRKVPKKSISLARTEMNSLELEEGLPGDVAASGKYNRNHDWPETLQHWWVRVGRSITFYRGSIKDKPIMSSIKINETLYSHSSTDMKHSKSDSTVPIITENNAGILKALNPNLNLNPEPKPRKKFSEETEGRTLHQSENENKLGFLSHYYSDAVVCERCYEVYQMLDYIRSNKQLSLRHENKAYKEAQLLSGQGCANYDEYARNIENRIFNQRKFVSRLAKIKQQPVVAEYDGNDLNGKSIATSTIFTAYPTNGSVESIQAEGSYFPYHSYFEADKDTKKSNKQKVVQGPSKNILPPLPWQLRNDPVQQLEYVNNMANKNKFVKNIGNRIQKENIILGALEQESMIDQYTNSSNGNSNWLQATGQSAEQLKQMRRDIQHTKSADSIVRKHKVVNASTFDSDRLLHPWQRELNRKKREAAEGEKKVKMNAYQKVERERGVNMGSYLDRDDEDEEPDAVFDPSQIVKKHVSRKSNSMGVLPPIHPHAGMSSAVSYKTSSIAELSDYQEHEEELSHQSPSWSPSKAALSKKSQLITKKLAEKIKSEDTYHPLFEHVDQIGKSSAQTGATKVQSLPRRQQQHEEEEDEDEDEEDDEGIGWSPFAIQS